MKRAWAGWVARFDATEPAYALAVVRILLALTILTCLVNIGVSGVLPLLWHDRAHGGMRDVSGAWWLVRLLGGPKAGLVDAIYGLAVTGAGLLLLGIGGRVTPLVLGQLLMVLFSLNSTTGGGHDRVMTCALFVLGFSGASATLSLPARLTTGRWLAPAMVPSWPRWVLFYQLGLIYMSTGMQKVGSDWLPWGDFRAIYYALQLTEWARWEHTWAGTAWGYPLTQLGTMSTLFLEWSGLVWVLAAWYAETPERRGRLRAWSNRLHLRELYLFLGLGLHIGIWITMNVGPFSPVMLSLYPCAYGGAWWARRLAAPRSDHSGQVHSPSTSTAFDTR